jgi:hypothetical protein
VCRNGDSVGGQGGGGGVGREKERRVWKERRDGHGKGEVGREGKEIGQGRGGEVGKEGEERWAGRGSRGGQVKEVWAKRERKGGQ